MLSIIIPTYNEEKYLPIVLSALSAQTMKDFEVIIVDAGSTDRTLSIAEESGLPMRVFKDEKRGPGAARNIGAKHANGDMLLFIDADAWVWPDFLEQALKKMHRKKLELATCLIKPLSRKQRDRIAMMFFLNLWVFFAQIIYPVGAGICIFTDRKLFEQLNGFDETIKLGEDCDYINKAAQLGKFRLLNTPVYTSTRRVDHEGRINYMTKYALASVHTLLLGKIRSDTFQYTFGQHSRRAAKRTIKERIGNFTRTLVYPTINIIRKYPAAVRQRLKPK